MKLRHLIKTLLFTLNFLRSAGGATLTYSDGVTHIFNPNGTLAGINVGSHAGDPSSLNNGDLWYSTSTNTLRARVNGSTISLANASHTHLSADITDAAASPDGGKLVKYGASGEIVGSSVTANGQLITGQSAGASGEIKFLDANSSYSLLFSLGGTLTEDCIIYLPWDEEEAYMATQSWANARFAVGPASAADNALARYDLTTGRLLQSSQITASDAGALAGVTAVQAYDVAGVALKNNTGGDVLTIGSSGNVAATAYGDWLFNAATADTIASFNGTKNLTGLSTATYPSLTELARVKGVTSAIQTQLDGKLATNGDGSSLTALNATQLTTGTIPDGRFPATLPAASGANLTSLNMDNAGSGTLAVSRGGTGATSNFAIWRQLMLGVTRYPALWWTPSTISGTATSGSQATSFFPFLSVATSTAGKARISMNIGNAGPVWPGGDNVVDFSRKVVVNLTAVVQLSAHADSRVSLHWTHASPTSHTSFDRSNKGLSICFRGGASAGTVYIQGHNGTTTADSATASYPINDVTGYQWALEWEPGVAARLYRNGTLQCTLSSGLPSGTQGSSSNGAVFILENTASGSGNATFFRFVDATFTELP